MAQRGPSLGEQPGQITGPEFGRRARARNSMTGRDDYDSPEEEPLSGEGYRVSVVLEEATKMFPENLQSQRSSSGWRVSDAF